MYNLTSVLGVVPYVDPKYLNNIKNKSQIYKLNPKSDVYSIGVLLWQISSGCRPFYAENVKYDIELIMDIKKGRREQVIKGTPIEYGNLYRGKYANILLYHYLNVLILFIFVSMLG